MRWTGPLESVGLLTVVPVPRSATASVRGVLPWAPLAGVLLGGLATGVAVLGARTASPLVGAVLGVLVLAVLTRGLHLDGLADTADGLGPVRDRERALELMRRGDVGPFGVAAVVLVLLLQIACAAALLDEAGGWAALWTAVVTGRLVLTRTGLPGAPVARGSTLGQAVAGTVRPAVLLAWVVVLAAVLGAAAWGDPALAGRLALAAAAGAAAAELVLLRARHRLGGVNGDVMGAMAEVATAAALLAAAVTIG